MVDHQAAFGVVDAVGGVLDATIESVIARLQQPVDRVGVEVELVFETRRDAVRGIREQRRYSALVFGQRFFEGALVELELALGVRLDADLLQQL